MAILQEQLTNRLSRQGTKSFQDNLKKNREVEEAKYNNDGNVRPLFNQRLFSSQKGVIITSEARKIMKKNETNIGGKLNLLLSKSEVNSMRPVVEGLRLIHHGKDYIKDVLCNVVTIESYEPFQYINKMEGDDILSCYYVMHGVLEVTYRHCNGKFLQVYEDGILYTHGSGEYIGLVSHEGPHKDFAPPASVYTKQACQEFPLNTIVVNQNTKPDALYFISSGHFQYCRRVVTERDNTVSLFDLGLLAPGDIFGQECVVNEAKSQCFIFSVSIAVCYRISSDELGCLRKERIMDLLKVSQPSYPPDEVLQTRARFLADWRRYRATVITQYIGKERNKSTRKKYASFKSSWLQRKEDVWNFLLAEGSPRPASTHLTLSKTVFTAPHGNSRNSATGHFPDETQTVTVISNGKTKNIHRPGLLSGATDRVESRDLKRMFANKSLAAFSAIESLGETKPNGGLLLLDTSEVVSKAKEESNTYNDQLQKKRAEQKQAEKWTSAIQDARDECKARLTWNRYRMWVLTARLSRLKGKRLLTRTNSAPSGQQQQRESTQS